MADAAGNRFVSLLSLMARLRGDGGCPWDREQTRASLKPYLLEEAYEVLEAIDEGSRDHLVEELGDLLFQVVFHCQLGAETEEFTIDDVIGQLCAKMTRRHPHVFGDRVVADSREALAQWEQIKHEEASGKDRAGSALDGVPAALPALLRAQRLQTKAARVGFDWTRWQDAWSKVQEEMGEAGEALEAGDDDRRAGGSAVLDGQRGPAARHGCRRVPATVLREVHPTIREGGGGDEGRGTVGHRGIDGRPRSGVGSGESAGRRGSSRDREAAMKCKIGKTTVVVERGDITEAEVDAVVNPANDELLMGTGVASALKRKGGVVIEEDALRQGPIEIGEAVLTVAGNLAATHVIHAVTMGKDLKADPEKITAATRATLAIAEKHKLSSLAFPALGSGIGGVPAAQSADAVMSTVIDHVKRGNSSLEKVLFVLYEDQAQKAFSEVLKRLGGVR